MKPRVLVDFHHSSLLRSLVLLFEGRLGMELYRPLGMEWYHEGFWAINNLEDTARQFLDLGSQPQDATAPLNDVDTGKNDQKGKVYTMFDPGLETTHKACTLDYFKLHQFDYVIASIPQHVEPFKELIKRYNPSAKLIVQIGNNWQNYDFGDTPVLASVRGPIKATKAIYYHQEFDLTVFNDTPVPATRKVYSFVNVIEEKPSAWSDYCSLKRLMERTGWEFRAYGGQCPDGNMTGPRQLAKKMREAAFIFNVKPGGDGFGHIIHNAYAVGRPVITRSSHYKGQLAEDLLVPGTFIDLDRYGAVEVQNLLTSYMLDPDDLEAMGRRAASRFDEVVDYTQEAKEIKSWIKNLA